MSIEHRIEIPKVWRSEIRGVVFFLVTLGLSLYLSHLLPWSVLKGDIWRTSETIVYLKLPLFWLVPAFILGVVMFRIYDVRFSITPHGIESRTGVLALRQVVSRVRFEDVRSIEVVQSVLDRLLDVGILEICTSATGGVEIRLEGVAAPREIQDSLLAERDERQKIVMRDGHRPKKSTDSEVRYEAKSV